MTAETRPALTPRETEIVALIGQGYSSQAISSRLNIAYETLKKHRQSVLNKLGLNTSAQLAAYAARQDGLTPSNPLDLRRPGRG